MFIGIFGILVTLLSATSSISQELQSSDVDLSNSIDDPIRIGSAKSLETRIACLTINVPPLAPGVFPMCYVFLNDDLSYTCFGRDIMRLGYGALPSPSPPCTATFVITGIIWNYVTAAEDDVIPVKEGNPFPSISYSMVSADATFRAMRVYIKCGNIASFRMGKFQINSIIYYEPYILTIVPSDAPDLCASLGFITRNPTTKPTRTSKPTRTLKPTAKPVKLTVRPKLRPTWSPSSFPCLTIDVSIGVSTGTYPMCKSFLNADNTYKCLGGSVARIGYGGIDDGSCYPTFLLGNAWTFVGRKESDILIGVNPFPSIKIDSVSQTKPVRFSRVYIKCGSVESFVPGNFTINSIVYYEPYVMTILPSSAPQLCPVL